MQRQRELAADEDELLRLQEQFAASAAQGDARPAAKVTRISRRPAAGGAGAAAGGSAEAPPAAAQQGCAQHGPACTGHQDDSEGQAGQQAVDLAAMLQSAMQGIVGEVAERPALPVMPPAPPQPPSAAAGDAFPQASHRKLSKFALGRQRERSAAAAAPSLSPALAAAPLLPAAGRMDDASSIDAENRQLLSAMTPGQVEEARAEALQRLPAAAVEFLRRRGAEKAAQAAAAAAAAPAAQAAGTAAHAAEGEAAGTAASAAGGGGRAVQRPRQRQQQRRAASQPAAVTGAGLAARLRFDAAGNVVGLRPAEAGGDAAPADVAQRDPIRSEGGGGEGYTVQEARLLARSTMPQQRVMALRVLASVLALSRPCPGGPAGGGLVPLPPAVIEQLREEGGKQGQQAAAVAAGASGGAAVEWVAVWHHALHAADVTVLLRRQLDDSHAAVAAAAAEALAALLGAAGPAGAAEEAAAEAADACPLTGWPAPPLRHLQRPTADGAWVAAPTSAEAQRRRGAGGEGEGEEDEEPLDEQQLAKVDPLSGLLHMQLLERAVYLIRVAKAAAALDPLLSILIRCCQAGKDVADQVLDTPGMLAALKQVLDAPPPPAGASSQDASSAALYAARPKALRLLRQLAAASKAAARRLQESGLVRFALEQLLRAAVAAQALAQTAEGVPAAAAVPAATAAAAGEMRRQGMLCEALRLWRAFAQHGFYLLSLDDAYPSLCGYFSPLAAALGTPAAQAAAGQAAGEQAAGEEAQQWSVAREAYSAAAQLCWHAARSGPEQAQLSPQCAAAVAAGALSWLSALPLQQLLEGHGEESSGADGQAADGRMGAAEAEAGGLAQLVSLSPFPALAAAAPGSAGGGSSQQAVVLGTLAAALNYVGSYWGVQVWHTSAEKAAAAQRLAGLGLLPAAASGGDIGSSEQLPPGLQAVRRLLQQLMGSAQAGGAQAGALDSRVVASAELAVALARLSFVFLLPRQAGTAAAALLAPLCAAPAPALFLAAAEAADPVLLQPWDAARMAVHLPLARAASAGLQAAALAARVDGQPQALPAAAADTMLALLQLLSPGDEANALQLMALLLGPQQLSGTLAAAATALQAAAGGKAGLLAEGGPAGAADGSNGTSFSPPSLPDAKQLSAVLLAGYAGAWLGMVPEQEQAEAGQQQRQMQAALEPPAVHSLLRPQGSRLPLPLDWPVSELPLPPAEAGVAADPATAAAGSLLLLLGWEEQGLASLGSSSSSAAPAAGSSGSAGGAAEQKLHAAVLLAFGEDARVGGGESSGIVPGAVAAPAAPAGSGGQEEQSVWQEPLVRWCLASLMERYCTASAAATGTAAAAASSSSTAAASDTPWQQQEARLLAQLFAAASYGDSLFGAAVALLLRAPVPSDTQLEVLSTLADEQALHLLPPLRLLPGPAAAYLGLPSGCAPAGSSGGFGRACFGAGGGEGGGSGGGRRQELDLYVKLLSDGPLERCLQAAGDNTGEASVDGGAGSSGGSEGNGACFQHCSVAVPLVLHRLACSCLPGEEEAAGLASQPQQQQRTALLCSILQRCAGGSPRQLALLGWLLRWDASAGQPSDAIPRERLAAIQAACAAAGLDAEALLRAAVQA